jgi:hypothetical protein
MDERLLRSSAGSRLRAARRKIGFSGSALFAGARGVRCFQQKSPQAPSGTLLAAVINMGGREHTLSGKDSVLATCSEDARRQFGSCQLETYNGSVLVVIDDDRKAR